MGIIMKNGIAYGGGSGSSDVIHMLAPEYSTNSQYAVGDCVHYEGNIYKCKVQISSGEAWNASHWDQSSVSELLVELLKKHDPTLVAKNITQNGTYNASADNADGFYIVTVNVPQNSASPTGTRNIISNGTYDVSNYANAVVNVQYASGTKTITESGNYKASDDGLDGFSEITVVVPSKTPRGEITSSYIFDLVWDNFATDENAMTIIEDEVIESPD